MNFVFVIDKKCFGKVMILFFKILQLYKLQQYMFHRIEMFHVHTVWIIMEEYDEIVNNMERIYFLYRFK